jgi:hypothetical protein
LVPCRSASASQGLYLPFLFLVVEAGKRTSPENVTNGVAKPHVVAVVFNTGGVPLTHHKFHPV